ncbi:hypothetical protein RJT34_14605 [Clitoria ternatea]|uniref:Uncharacterized protein n=1 Tax=Clitoria ternatea TaxID=43366 RepID=A0AAN9PNB0_CLITE
MADSLMQLLRLLGEEDHAEESQPQTLQRHRNNRVGALRRHNSPPHSLANSGTQNMNGLINNAGYVQGNGNGSIIFGPFDSTTRTYN